MDLSSGKISEETPDDKLYADYIGGYGIGARILYSRQKAKVDPLGPDNTLGLVTGPLTGTPALTGTRFVVVGKSPKTVSWYEEMLSVFTRYLESSGIIPVLANFNLESVRAFIVYEQNRGLSPYTVQARVSHEGF